MAMLNAFAPACGGLPIAVFFQNERANDSNSMIQIMAGIMQSIIQSGPYDEIGIIQEVEKKNVFLDEPRTVFTVMSMEQPKFSMG